MLYKSNYSREDWDLTGDGWAEVKQELDLRKNRIVEIVRKKNEFVESVNKIINSYETLAPALKAWQPLWDLVPEEYKERHRKVVERTKNEVVLDVNLDTLTAQVIKSKLTR
jgi:predicted ATP-dependent protease